MHDSEAESAQICAVATLVLIIGLFMLPPAVITCAEGRDVACAVIATAMSCFFAATAALAAYACYRLPGVRGAASAPSS